VLRVLKRTDPIPGKDIVLSLDIKLQEAAEAALGGRRGAVVALDPNTGEVLAMVSQPSFDPNLFVTGISFKAYAELRDSIDRPLFNRVLRGLYPPGSTIKPAVAIAGLDAGVVTASTGCSTPATTCCPTTITNTATGTAPATAGSTWTRRSCAPTTPTSMTWRTSWASIVVGYMSKFGIGQKVSLDMFEESPGLMPSREWKRATRRQAWFPGETLILGIGQGYMQSPLQLAQATALVANKGIWNRPHLAKTIEGQKPVDDNPMPDRPARPVGLDQGQPRHAAGDARRPWHRAQGGDRCAVPHRRQERYRPGGGDQAGRKVRPLQGSGAPPRPRLVRRLRPGR
jgi:penicillin-binding protein 2